VGAVGALVCLPILTGWLFREVDVFDERTIAVVVDQERNIDCPIGTAKLERLRIIAHPIFIFVV
jgi:hypothetical protein